MACTVLLHCHFESGGLFVDYSGLICLQDPAGNKINQWRVAEKELREAAGVFESEMAMSDSPVLGDWKLEVETGVSVC